MLVELNADFFATFEQFQEAGYEVIVVHGGGPAINKELAKNHVASTVLNGIRVTSEDAIKIVQSTIIGQVNPALVHQLNRAGIEAIGLSGNDGKLLTCSYLDESVYGFVGDIQHVNVELIEKVLAAGLVPVISCIGSTDDGTPLNINADTVASRLALALGTESLLLVTDTAGITIDNNVQQIASPSAISAWIASGEIHGGMLPKVEAALASLQAGVPSVQIVGRQLRGTLITKEEALV